MTVGEFVLTMLDSGELVEIPVPQGDEQKPGKSSGRTQRKRQSTAKTKSAKWSGVDRPRRSPQPIWAHVPCAGRRLWSRKSRSVAVAGEDSGCSLTIWKTIAGKRISARTAKALLRDESTAVLKGFKSKSGQPFSARLKLQAGKVTFDFDS